MIAGAEPGDIRTSSIIVLMGTMYLPYLSLVSCGSSC